MGQHRTQRKSTASPRFDGISLSPKQPRPATAGSWWMVPPEQFSEAAKAQRDRLTNATVSAPTPTAKDSDAI